MIDENFDCTLCDCYDPDYGCTMPSIDKCYACPLYSDSDTDIDDFIANASIGDAIII